MVRAGLFALAAALSLGSFFVPPTSPWTSWSPPATCPWTVDGAAFPEGAPPQECMPGLPGSLSFPDLEPTADEATWQAFSWAADPNHYAKHVVLVVDDQPPPAREVAHPSRRVRMLPWYPWSNQMLLDARDTLQAFEKTPRHPAWKHRRADLQRTLDWGAWVHRHRPDMERWRTAWRQQEVQARQDRVVLKLVALQSERERQRQQALRSTRLAWAARGVSLLLLLVGWRFTTLRF